MVVLKNSPLLHGALYTVLDLGRGLLCLEVYQTAGVLSVFEDMNTVLFRGGLWGVGCMPAFPWPGGFGYGCGFFCGSSGILLQNDKDSGATFFPFTPYNTAF